MLESRRDYPELSLQVSDTVGWFEGRMLLRHRLPLTGAFDLQLSLSEFDLFDGSIGLDVTRDRFEVVRQIRWKMTSGPR